ncbi:MAG: hypothetical protein QM765_41935 [Myxococcales bacterium]
MPSLAWWVISLLAKTEQRAVMATVPAAASASLSASASESPKRAAMRWAFSPVPEEHLSLSR